MRPRRILDVTMATLAGVAMAIVLAAFSLARIAERPSLPGTQPDPRFVTLMSVSHGSDFSDGGSVRYASIARWVLPPDQPITATATQRRMAYPHGAEDRVKLGIFSGPMFESLGVRLIGRPPSQPDLETSLRGTGGVPLEMAVSERTAKRWFGQDIASALDQTVEVDSMLARMGVEPVSFRISAVFDDAFPGPSSTTHAEVWIPLNSWPDVMVPSHQSELMQSLPVRFVGAFAGTDIPAMEARIGLHMLDDRDGKSMRILALPGLGIEGHSRLIYARWAQSLLWFAGALFLMLGAFVLTMRPFELARRRGEDETRAAFGEDGQRWWRRHHRQSIGIVVLTAASCAITLVAGYALAHRFDVPFVQAIRAIPDHLASWLAICTFAALIGWMPLILHRIRRGDSGTSERRLMTGARAMIIVTLSGVAILSAAATAHILALNRLADRDLGFDSHAISFALRAKSGKDGQLPTNFDSRDATTLLAEFAELGVAAATATPVERVATVQGTHRLLGAPTQTLFAVNFVSANYFDVLSVRTDSRCGPFDRFAPNQALFNAEFARQFQLNPSVTEGLQLSTPGVNGEIALCGIVPNIQLDDVRADPRPTIYLPLKRLGDLGALIATADTPAKHLTAIETALYDHASDIAFARWRPLTDQIAEQLQDERALSRIGLISSSLALVLGIAICAFATLSAAELMARALAIRSALGASRRRLLLLLFFPAQPKVRLAAILLLAIACLGALRQFEFEAPDLSLSLLAASLAVVACVATGLAFVMRSVSETRLRDWLANRT